MTKLKFKYLDQTARSDSSDSVCISGYIQDSRGSGVICQLNIMAGPIETNITLDVSADELLAYCEEHGLSVRDRRASQ